MSQIDSSGIQHSILRRKLILRDKLEKENNDN